MSFKIIVNIIVLSFINIQTIAEVPNLTLNNGHKMPILGIGTCCGITKEESLHMIKEAIDVGFRHIDTAYIYGNEVEVGLAVDEKILAGTIRREDIFITTKLWNTFHSETRAMDGIQMALKKLNLKYIDLMLIHWPMGYFEGTNDVPKNSQNEIIFSSVDYLETWAALEEAVAQGIIKSIGVSNFNSEQLERLIEHAKIKPSVNQIESHPRLIQKELIDFCHKHGIAVTAYSPFAGGHLIEDSTLTKIGDNHKKSSAQVMVRYQIQRGVSVIPRSTQRNRMEEDFNVFDFQLTTDEMQVISGMNRDFRYNKEESAKKHKFYPFSIPYI